MERTHTKKRQKFPLLSKPTDSSKTKTKKQKLGKGLFTCVCVCMFSHRNSFRDASLLTARASRLHRPASRTVCKIVKSPLRNFLPFSPGKVSTAILFRDSRDSAFPISLFKRLLSPPSKDAQIYARIKHIHTPYFCCFGGFTSHTPHATGRGILHPGNARAENTHLESH